MPPPEFVGEPGRFPALGATQRTIEKESSSVFRLPRAVTLAKERLVDETSDNSAHVDEQFDQDLTEYYLVNRQVWPSQRFQLQNVAI